MIIGESARFCVEEYKLSPKMMILPDSLGISVHYTQFPQEPGEPSRINFELLVVR